MKGAVRIFVSLVVFGFIFAAGPVMAQPAQAEWTLMFYMDSDNDLESAQMEDLDEMMKVGSSANVNIVVLADRSPKGAKGEERQYTNRAVGGLPNWTTAKLLYVNRGGLREIADLGEVNMGDPETLRKFVLGVSDAFPAKRYGLVFGNHGDGWRGIAGDETNKHDSLTAKDLVEAFSAVTPKIGKIELLGFDACLMANFESAHALAPHGRAMVASEELEPGTGWNYTPIMQALTQNPQMDGFAFGRVIVDAYREYYLGKDMGNRDKTVTLSMIDLGKIPSLEAAVNNFSAAKAQVIAADARNSTLKMARARAASSEFGKSSEDGMPSSDYYDLSDYAANLKKQMPSPEIAAAADRVIAAVAAAVPHKINGEVHQRAGGISVFFPLKAEAIVNAGRFSYRDVPFSKSGRWSGFLDQYLKISNADKTAPVLEKVKTDDPKVATSDVVKITSSVKADDIAEATFVLAEAYNDGEIIIGAIPTEPDENGKLEEEWDGSWFSIGDSKKELICPITSFEAVGEDDETYLVEVPAQIRAEDSDEWRDVTLYFYLDFTQENTLGEFVYAFEFDGRQAREIDVYVGDSIRPVYLAIDKNGDSELVASTDENDILTFSEDDDINVGRMDVAPGDYFIGFEVTDLSGNSVSEFTEVAVE